MVVGKAGRRQYYWLVAVDPDSGRTYLIFGGSTEAEAREKGLEMLAGVDFEIREFPTRDLARASSLLKGRRLEDTRSLKMASRRLGHDRSLRRWRRRRE